MKRTHGRSDETAQDTTRQVHVAQKLTLALVPDPETNRPSIHLGSKVVELGRDTQNRLSVPVISRRQLRIETHSEDCVEVLNIGQNPVKVSGTILHRSQTATMTLGDNIELVLCHLPLANGTTTGSDPFRYTLTAVEPLWSNKKARTGEPPDTPTTVSETAEWAAFHVPGSEETVRNGILKNFIDRKLLFTLTEAELKSMLHLNFGGARKLFLAIQRLQLQVTEGGAGNSQDCSESTLAFSFPPTTAGGDSPLFESIDDPDCIESDSDWDKSEINQGLRWLGRNGHGLESTPSQEDSGGVMVQPWVMCDACGKWRKTTQEFAEEEMFQCVDCFEPEDSWQDDEPEIPAKPQTPTPPTASKRKRSSAAKPRAKSNPNKYIGRKVRKCFFDGWYSGEVTEFDRHTGYRILYEDGDQEDLNEKDLRKILV